MTHLSDDELQGKASSYDEAMERALRSLWPRQAWWKDQMERQREVLLILRQELPASGAIATDPRFQDYQGWPLVTALLQLSLEARYREPGEMRWLAFEACLAAEETSPETFGLGQEGVYDLRAQTWLELANAHRVSDDFHAAEAALTKAKALQRLGTGDPLLQARATDVEASLRNSQRRIPEACALLEETYRLYFELGDRHLAGRALVSQGICLRRGGEPHEAVASLQKGLDLLEARRDPQLVAVTHQALIDALVDDGDLHRAAEILSESCLHQAFASDPLNLLRLRWVEGKILAGLGRLSLAERILEEVQNQFQEKGLKYDAALAGLDLAAVWLRQETAKESLPR